MPAGRRPLPDVTPLTVDPDRAAVIAQALGHPARSRIVRLLLERRTCIGGDIVDDIGLAQSTVSEHRRIPEAAGIIQGEIERPRVCDALHPASLLPLAGLIDAILDRAGQTPACCPDEAAVPLS